MYPGINNKAIIKKISISEKGNTDVIVLIVTDNFG
jgi:hypothetical protein